MVFGKVSVLTIVGVLGVVALGVVAALRVGGAVGSASVSLVSGTLSAVESLLFLVFVSSQSLTELGFPGCFKGGFLSRPHFLNTGSRYRFKCSPEQE